MASIHREITVTAPPAEVWDAIREVDAPHKRLAPGFLTDTRMEGDARVVTFANGIVARELIVDVGGRMTHHNASLQVFAAPDGGSRVVWIADLLPHELRAAIAGLIEQGMAVMQRTLSRS
jgi:carbon monoxide dehydrogenase subunit G